MKWKDNEIIILTELYPDHYSEHVASIIGRPVKQIYSKANSMNLKKSEAFRKAEHCRQADRLREIGVTGRFSKGHVPTNKGKSMAVDLYEKCKGTMFKKGNLPPNTKHNGYERVSKDGYIEVRVSKGKFRLKHRLLWEKANGIIPKGHVVIFKDGDKRNFELSNFELISCRENMIRNSSQRFGSEIFKAIQLRGALNRQINKHSKNIKNGKK